MNLKGNRWVLAGILLLLGGVDVYLATHLQMNE